MPGIGIKLDFSFSVFTYDKGKVRKMQKGERESKIKGWGEGGEADR